MTDHYAVGPKFRLGWGWTTEVDKATGEFAEPLCEIFGTLNIIAARRAKILALLDGAPARESLFVAGQRILAPVDEVLRTLATTTGRVRLPVARKRPVGRPRKDADERVRPYTLSLSPVRRRKYEEVAGARPLSAWILEVCDAAAEGCEK